MKIRKANINDIKVIHKLVNEFARKGQMIPRALNDLYENIRDLSVCEDGGEIKGVCALHVLWEDLAEVRSLAVRTDAQSAGIGRKLVSVCLKEAKALGIARVFALTYQDAFFKKIGFREIDNQSCRRRYGESA